MIGICNLNRLCGFFSGGRPFSFWKSSLPYVAYLQCKRFDRSLSSLFIFCECLIHSTISFLKKKQIEPQFLCIVFCMLKNIEFEVCPWYCVQRVCLCNIFHNYLTIAFCRIIKMASTPTKVACCVLYQEMVNTLQCS